MKLILFLVLTALCSNAFAQTKEKKIKIDFHVGISNQGAQYQRLEKGEDVGFDFNYFFTENFILAAHWNLGYGHYYETRYTEYHEELGGRIGKNGIVNANIYQNNVGFLAGYNFNFTNRFSATAYLGISQLLNIRENIPVALWRDDEGLLQMYGPAIDIYDKVAFDVAVPVKINIGFRPFSFFEFGITGGFHYAILSDKFEGFYLGPQIGVLF